MPKPFVISSVAVSLDGYIDDASPNRLLLSNAEDLERVDEVRASCDAILVGANTIRQDNPRLLVRSVERRQARVEVGKPESPVKVVLAGHKPLDCEASFFTAGETLKIVYAATGDIEQHRAEVDGLAEVVDGGSPLDLTKILADLTARGIERLMVEGGGAVHTQFLEAGLVDELHLAIAPFFVGDAAAPRFVNPAAFAAGPANRMTLVELRPIGDVIFARYQP